VGPERQRPQPPELAWPAGLRISLSRSIEASVVAQAGEHPGITPCAYSWRWEGRQHEGWPGLGSTPGHPAAERPGGLRAAITAIASTAGTRGDRTDRGGEPGLTGRCRASSSSASGQHRAVSRPPQLPAGLCSSRSPAGCPLVWRLAQGRAYLGSPSPLRRPSRMAGARQLLLHQCVSRRPIRRWPPTSRQGERAQGQHPPGK